MAEGDGLPAREEPPAPSAQPWEVLSRRSIVHDPWLRLEAERVRTSTGMVLDPWYMAHSHHWACAIAITPDRHLVMVEQYRHGVGAWGLEIPAGNVDAGEQPMVAAMRELAEESGYRSSSQPQPLGAWWPEPAHNSACAHGFLVQVPSERGAQSPDLGEHLRVHLETFEGVDRAIQSGRFCHGVQIAFWFAARARGLI